MSEHIGAKPVEYTILKNPLQREVIKRRAVDLAHAAHTTSTVVFLDKKARPFADLLRSIYPVIYPGEALPNIRFVNLGTEKKDSPEIGYGTSNSMLDGDTSPLKTLNDVVRIYGEENIDTLKKVLTTSSEPEQRLVVDDVVSTGGTKTLTQKILGIVDPDNSYSFFPFLDSPDDVAPFQKSHGHALVPWVPWADYSILAKDRSEPDLSFTLSGTINRGNRGKLQKLKKEFDALANEIAKERAQTASASKM